MYPATPTRPARGSALYRGLPPILGGKRRVAPLVFATLADFLPSEEWLGLPLVDPFVGGGALAVTAKALGFEVTAGDLAARGAIVARALIENSTQRLGKIDIAATYTSIPPELLPSQREFYGAAFSAVEDQSEPKRALLQLALIKMYLREFPGGHTDVSDAERALDDPDTVSPARLGTFARATDRRGPNSLWRTAERVNASVIGGTGHAAQGDALELLGAGDWAVAMLDPPYPSVRGYGRSYRRLDELLGDEALADARAPSLNDVLDAAHAVPVIALTYGGSSVDLATLVHAVGRHRHVDRALALPLRHLPALNRRDRTHDDFLVIASRR